MKQSNNNKKSRDVTAFLYERLSRDDNMDGESYSIGNQKKLLTKVAKEKGYTNLVHFFDDGISGVTMDRPGFADMIQQLEQGKAAAVFALDMATGNNNMQTVKQAAAHGQEVALVDAQILVKTHKSHAHKTDERCADIILIRLFTENDPIQKRDEYAIGRRQKGVFARCRVHQPIGLHRVRRRKACTHYSAALEVLLIKLL